LDGTPSSPHRAFMVVWSHGPPTTAMCPTAMSSSPPAGVSVRAVMVADNNCVAAPGVLRWLCPKGTCGRMGASSEAAGSGRSATGASAARHGGCVELGPVVVIGLDPAQPPDWDPAPVQAAIARGHARCDRHGTEADLGWVAPDE